MINCERGASGELRAEATRQCARVAPLTATEARSPVEVRQRLDPLAVRLAAERWEAADVTRILEAVALYRASHYAC